MAVRRTDLAAEARQIWMESAAQTAELEGVTAKQRSREASIGYPRKPTAASDSLAIDIYPQGKNTGGVRNAEVAFVLHYGTSKMPGSRWVDDADSKSGPRVTAAMTRIWDTYLETGTVPAVEVPSWTAERRAAKANAPRSKSTRFRD